MPDWIEAGEIVGTHGILGELKVNPWCDSPEFLLGFSVVRAGTAEFSVRKARKHKNQVLLMLAGIESVEQAQALRGRTLYIDRAGVTLPEGRYFVKDLEGLAVLNADGSRVETLYAVLQMPAQDVYHVRGDDGDHYIPAVPEFVKDINLDAGIMHVALIEGM